MLQLKIKQSFNFNTKFLQNLVFDLAGVMLALFGWLLIRLMFCEICEDVYLLLCSLFIFHFGLKHYERQIYITLFFLLGIFGVNLFSEVDNKYFFILYTMFLGILSLVAYLFPLKQREKHIALNDNFVAIKEDYNLALGENNSALQKIDFYNKNVDIMFNIYNLSRKMISTVDTADVLTLSIEFFEKLFADSENNFFIFDYDLTQNRYTVLFHKMDIPENLLFKFGIFWKTKFKNDFFENQDIKPILFNRENLFDNGMYDFLDYSVKYALFVPIIRQEKFIKMAVVIFKSDKFLNYLNLEYFDIFYKQMSLGILKIDMYREIQERSITDPLTNIYRRSFFEEKFDYEVRRNSRENIEMAVLMIDIDFFKNYNDKYGHLVGDKVLVCVAELLKKNVYETDIVARYGGEEFLILLPRADRKKAIAKAERIRKDIELTNFVENIDDKITVSIGISCFPSDGMTQKELVEKADNALYYAKNNGRNRVVDYLEVKKVLNNE